MAKLITYSDVPQNAFRTVNLPQPAYGVLIENNANVAVTVRDDVGKNPNTCPPGLSIGWNYPEGLYAPSVGCVGSYQGNARVYFYDGALDLQGNPPAQQPPGLVTMTDATAHDLITALTAQVVTLNALVTTLNGKTDTTNSNTGSMVGYEQTTATNTGTAAANTGTTATNTLNLYTSSEGTRSNTGLMTNIYAKNTQPFTLTTATNLFSQSIPYAINTYAVQFASIDNGFLSVYYTFNGVNMYSVRHVPFYGASSNYSVSTEKVYTRPIPANSTINVLMEQMAIGSTVVGTLKW